MIKPGPLLGSRHKERWCYSSPLPLLLSQSSYFWPLGKESIDREVPAIITPNLQERAKAALSQNKRYRNRKTDRKYLLVGLVKCAVCGFACVGHPSTTGGKKYHFYACSERSTERVCKDPPPHRRPYVNAKWLEETVWADVRGFL